MIAEKNKTQKSLNPRTLVIGDIHGSAKALEQVLDRAYVTEKDTIIQLGDVADGWSETSECVDILLGINNLISVRGNHDVWVYDWIKYGRTPTMWTQQGGQATLDSYVRTGRFLDKDHKDFWNRQLDWYIDDDNRLFIHAGWDYKTVSEQWSYLTPLDLFEKQASMFVNAGTIAKECHWDRSLLQGAKSAQATKRGNSNAVFRATEAFKEVYIGHTATRSHLPEKHMNVYNLDSGAGWSGKLTIMDVDTKEYWQSDYSKDLYPDEKGR